MKIKSKLIYFILRLNIVVDPISVYSNKLFIISFENVDSIHLLKKAYKNYENLISDLEFDGHNILIKNEKADLVYVS